MSEESQDSVKLRLVMSDGIRDSQSQPFDVVLVHDASGSVSNADFQKSLDAAMRLANSFSPVSRFAIIQFGTNVKIECDLTRDREKLQTQVNAMKKDHGGTNTTEALRAVRDVLRKARPGSKLVCYLFTDGVPSDQLSCVQAAKDLREEFSALEFNGVGIGHVNRQQLAEVCGENRTFLLKDFDSLVDAIPGGHNHVSNSEVSFDVTQKPKPIKLKEDLKLEVTIYNSGLIDVPANARLEFDGAQFYHPLKQTLGKAIKKETKETFSVTLHPTSIASIKTLPNAIKFSLIDPMTTRKYFSGNSGFLVDLPNILGDLVDWAPADPKIDQVDILIFGPAGSGKSTLVNFSLSLWNDISKGYQEFAIATRRAGHVTNKTEAHMQPKSRFRFVDTVGLSDNNYVGSTFEQVLEGARLTKVELEASQSPQAEGSQTVYSASAQKTDETVSEDRILCCIFVLTQGFRSYETAKPEKIERLKDFVCRAADRMLRPILVVTRMDDTTDPDEEVRKKFHELTGISTDSIYLARNIPEMRNDPANEKELYQILAHALQNCQTSMETRLITAENMERKKRLKEERLKEENRRKQRQEDERKRKEEEERQEEERKRKGEEERQEEERKRKGEEEQRRKEKEEKDAEERRQRTLEDEQRRLKEETKNKLHEQDLEELRIREEIHALEILEQKEAEIERQRQLLEQRKRRSAAPSSSIFLSPTSSPASFPLNSPRTPAHSSPSSDLPHSSARSFASFTHPSSAKEAPSPLRISSPDPKEKNNVKVFVLNSWKTQEEVGELNFAADLQRDTLADLREAIEDEEDFPLRGINFAFVDPITNRVVLGEAEDQPLNFICSVSGLIATVLVKLEGEDEHAEDATEVLLFDFAKKQEFAIIRVSQLASMNVTSFLEEASRQLADFKISVLNIRGSALSTKAQAKPALDFMEEIEEGRFRAFVKVQPPPAYSEA